MKDLYFKKESTSRKLSERDIEIRTDINMNFDSQNTNFEKRMEFGKLYEFSWKSYQETIENSYRISHYLIKNNFVYRRFSFANHICFPVLISNEEKLNILYIEKISLKFTWFIHHFSICWRNHIFIFHRNLSQLKKTKKYYITTYNTLNLDKIMIWNHLFFQKCDWWPVKCEMIQIHLLNQTNFVK